MRTTEAPPICNECGNNLCRLDIATYARKHLSHKGRGVYKAMVKSAETFVLNRMPLEIRRYFE